MMIVFVYGSALGETK